MSAGSRKLLAEAGSRLESEKPIRPTDVVIVKVRTDRPTVRRLAAAAHSATSGASGSVLASLVENGYAREVTPIFPAPLEFAGASRGVRALAAAAAAPGPRGDHPGRRSRGLLSVKVERGTNAEHLADHLRRAGTEVEFAFVPPVKYPMPVRKARGRSKRAAASNDPLLSRQWGHGAVKIHTARARPGFHDGHGTLVAVLDSGVDKEHPDLKPMIQRYTNFLSATESDDDFKGHGTHVAGIIAAVINNQVGVAGLCAAKIVALKALPRRGKPWNAEAYYQALGSLIGSDVRVLNMSLGGGQDPAEEAIVLDLIDSGVAVVAAMGNEFEEGNPTSYPAAYAGVIAVGATDEVDRRASFSCTGAHIALVAPGERILSTVPTYPTELAAETDYDSWPGTSMATPHVAAAAALLLAKRPTLTPAEVKTRLTRRADRVRWQTRRPDEEYGWGRLNIAGRTSVA